HTRFKCDWSSDVCSSDLHRVDLGFKAYFGDGAQVVPPHDKGIVAEVNAVPLADLAAFLQPTLAGVTTLGRDADDAYLAAASKARSEERRVGRECRGRETR